MINKAIIIGRLGQDPEVRYTQAGKPVASFSVATTEKWKGQDGQVQEQTEWHRVVAWNRLAEICGEYLAKGSLVYIEGKLQTRQWEDQSGQKRYTTEIVAREMKMLDSQGNRKGAGGGQQQDGNQQPEQPGMFSGGQQHPGHPGHPGNLDDNVPF